MAQTVGVMGIHQYIVRLGHGAHSLESGLSCFFDGLIGNYYATARTKSRPVEIKKALRHQVRRAFIIDVLFWA
jgi:hypothetical protein